MKPIAWMAGSGLALTVAACGASAPRPQAGPPTVQHTSAQHTSPHSGDGKVIGAFIRVGGPLGQGGKQPPSVPLSGTLSFSAGHRRTIAVRVGQSGRYSVWLPADTYLVSGRSPSMLDVSASGATRESPCSQEIRLTIAAGKTVRMDVICPVP
jgi:hypothetical protein